MKELAETGAIFAMYTFPFVSLTSKEMQLASHLGLWLWCWDEYLEELSLTQDFNNISMGTEQFVELVHSGAGEFKDVPGCTQFRGLYESFQDIWRDAIENKYGWFCMVEL